MAPRRPYRLLEHTADIRARITGRTRRRLFQNAVFTLTDLLVEARRVRSRSSKMIRVSAPSEDLLAVRLLQEILFLFDAKHFVTRRLEFVSWSGNKIMAKARGEKLNAERHRPKTEIKAVTLHGLKYYRAAAAWCLELTFDV